MRFHVMSPFIIYYNIIQFFPSKYILTQQPYCGYFPPFLPNNNTGQGQWKQLPFS